MIMRNNLNIINKKTIINSLNKNN